MKLCCQNPSFIDIWSITDSFVVKDGKWKVAVRMTSSLEMLVLPSVTSASPQSEPTAPHSERNGSETTSLSDVCDSSALLWSVSSRLDRELSSLLQPSYPSVAGVQTWAFSVLPQPPGQLAPWELCCLSSQKLCFLF